MEAVKKINFVLSKCRGRENNIVESFATRAEQFPSYMRKSGLYAALLYYASKAVKSYEKLVCEYKDITGDSSAGYACWLYGLFLFLTSPNVKALLPSRGKPRLIFCVVPTNRRELLLVFNDLSEMDAVEKSVLRKLVEIYAEAAKMVSRFVSGD